MTIEVLNPGAQTSVQDAGRCGYLHTGLSSAGPMDSLSLRIANLLVRNEIPSPPLTKGPRGDAGLELTMVGPTLRFTCEAVIALTGAEMPARLNKVEIAHYQSIFVPAGSVLELGAARRGCRTYLAVGGGIMVAPILGSRSQNLFAMRGPLGGRALRAGDRLPIRSLLEIGRRPVGDRFDVSKLPKVGGEFKLRVVLGPQDLLFEERSVREFLSQPWKLSTAANRTGMRFKGPLLNFRRRPSYLERDAGPDPSNIVDDVIPVGGIQCPSGVEAIVMGTENPTVGGFAKIATVISSDMAMAGQMRPGEVARFSSVSLDEAIEAARESANLAAEANVYRSQQ